MGALTVHTWCARRSAPEGIRPGRKICQLDVHKLLEQITIPHGGCKEGQAARRVGANQLLLEGRTPFAVLFQAGFDALRPANLDLDEVWL